MSFARHVFNKRMVPLMPTKNIFTQKLLHSNIDPPPPTHTTAHDVVNFFISCVHCSVVFSVLWGFESYRDKMKMIEDTNHKINEIVVAYRLLEKKCITKRSSTSSSS
uniref:Uncharacterized protein n=1 Tax=viral metagenome TaxID=1070528 RepID=A0A6C0KIS0_9ZZZZ